MNDDQQPELLKVIAKAWSDADFKQRLLSDPKAALSEMGIEPPEGMEDITLKVFENTADTVHLVLPVSPLEGDLDDDELDGVAGGGIGHVFGDAFKIIKDTVFPPKKLPYRGPPPDGSGLSYKQPWE